MPDVTTPFDSGSADAAFAAVPIVIAAVVVLMVVLIVVNLRRAKKLGVNPLTLETDLAAKLAKDGFGGGRTLRERLAELDRLRADGTLTAEEHAAARRAALEGRT
ncbi:hypothetical protein [Rathayibacter sp. VKM Ac-2630]|uniref:hypothetical protein n=1 Tax=Rathayibacter sp. VKM Ac-2630 TaxID=1938617 RepID=UPI0009820D32|nr:hypothetical protein [Rathayibacter sp. VKM Ac-2630]OOB92009.1 hypothetical protein B0T42_02960 [Rathayibacter sp. VKM Ac-2630]